MKKLPQPTIEYKYGLNEMEEFEMKFKGYRNDVIVIFSDDIKYELCFYDLSRLGQDVQDEEMIYEPGLVVVKEVTKENIEKAVIRMWKENFFNKLQPSSPE